MRIAVVSDLHANKHAVDAISLDIQAQRAEEVWCLGDVVGYGAFPRETMLWAEQACSVTVKGNHDQAVATGEVEGFNPVAATAARYHAQALTPPERARLHDLPLEASRSLGQEAALLVHASPDDPLREYVYPATARRDLERWAGRADVILLGHTHTPFAALYTPEGAKPWRLHGFEHVIEVDAPTSHQRPLALVNPGSVGQPRDGDPRAAYVLIETTTHTMELRRVAYDIDAAASAIRQARLDPFLAQRLYRGI